MSVTMYVTYMLMFLKGLEHDVSPLTHPQSSLIN